MAFLDILPLILLAFTGALVAQAVAFMFSLYMKRVDVVDVAWGLSAIAIVFAMQLSDPYSSTTVWLVTALVVLWGLRLSFHIVRRISRSDKQDPRYTTLMAKWPKSLHTLQVFTKIFFFQAVLATLVSLPVVVVYQYQPAVQVTVVLGAALWFIGYGFEVVADAQLRRFLQSSQRGELMQRGLWRYSRHPNYFGEITMWWGIALMTFTTPLWWLSLIGALTITLLIVFVSGVPLAEASASRKAGWREYKRTTSVLLPIPPKRM